MKVDTALAFCLLCFHFETLHGVENCSSLEPCPKGLLSYSQKTDEFPKENFTFHCPLPSNVKGFDMKLFKGQREVCSLYIDNGKKDVKSEKDFCDVVHSGDKVSFILKNLKSKHSDTYTCCRDILTPVFSRCKAGEKHLYIEESNKSCLASEEPCLLSEPTSWILIGLTIFALVICIFCLITYSFRNVLCQHVHSSHDYNNEYMSMAAVKSS
ncbi:uncharacterized protein LOC121919432 [Sceloporus undulatus]|uniref:uncharacterized protein LOC121919432 n=1 Tax=Sceloporus undulatus TaxID=8520 RepID=UPI001C4AC41A|nr:uncharacterized protein LOC121919432 [Sceloporus undulatus]